MVRRFFNYYRPHFFYLGIDIVAVVFYSGLSLVLPLLIRELIDEVIPARDPSLLLRLSILVTLLCLFKFVFRFLQDYFGHLLSQLIERDLRADLFRHFQKLSFAFYDRRKVGELMSRMTNDISRVNAMANHAPEDLFTSVLMVLGSFVVLFTIDPLLALLTFTSVPIMFFFAVFFGKRMFKGFREVNKKIAVINHRVENTLSGIRVVKSFVRERYEIDRFQHDNQSYYQANARVILDLGIFLSGTSLIRDLAQLIVISSGGYFVYLNRVSVGDLVAFLFYVNIFLEPIQRLARVNEMVQLGFAGLERFFQILDTEPDIEDNPEALELVAPEGRIGFEELTFSYDRQTKVFRDLSLQVEAGETVALVGPSGVGKTTLCSLVPRFYDPDQGKVTIDGRDIRDFTIRSLRRNIGLVQQDVFLFSGTVQENISYGKPEASKEEIEEAARRAHAHGFIMELSEGYQTEIGERGVKLSGGQKQRLSLARIFLKDPPILILDEATSSLDAENEQYIQNSLEVLSRDRTTLIIAHRLSTIREADRIVVLDEEGIEAIGTHCQLLEEGGLYSSLYRSQFAS